LIASLHKEYPDSRCSLDFESPYELPIGTILSAQSTDNQVNKITPNFFQQYPTVSDLEKANLEDIKELIKSIGLYNNKSKSIFRMAKQVMNDFNGEIPNTMKGLTSLGGVGRKTANVVLGNAFKIPDSGITVDTHVLRLSKRIGLSRNENAVKVEKDLMKIIPVKEWVDITHLMIDHGRKICGRKPKCNECVISNWCNARFKFDHFKK